MFMKICIAAAVMLGLIVAVPIASSAAGDNDKSASSTKVTAHKKKPKKGLSDEAAQGLLPIPSSTPCHSVREPVTTQNGNVIYRNVQVCN